MKLSEGMLCRDKDDTNFIVFFQDHTRQQISLDHDGVWISIVDSAVDIKEWPLGNWTKEYNLKPPKPGNCFAVSIQL